MIPHVSFGQFTNNFTLKPQARFASVPAQHTTGDTFFASHAPKFGVVNPTIGNGDPSTLIARKVDGQENQFEVVDTNSNDVIGLINVTDPATSAQVTPYAGKGGQYVTITANGVSASVGAGGQLTMGGVAITMNPDKTIVHDPIVDEATALAAATLNERPPVKQDYVKRMYLPASGIGSRLQPLLDQLGGETKPNVDLYPGTSILKELVNHYSHFGIEEFIIAVPQSRLEFFQNKLSELPDGVSINFIAEDKQSGTAGPLGRALLGEEGFTIPDDEPILVGMGDAVLKSDVDIAEMIEAHKQSGADATLAVAQVPEHLIERYGMVTTETPNQSSIITGFKEKPKTDEAKAALGEHRLANTAIYVLEPRVLQQLPKQYERVRSGEIDAKDNGIDFAYHIFEANDLDEDFKFFAHKFDFDKWVDVGNFSTYKEVVNRIANGQVFGEEATKAMRQALTTEGGALLMGGLTEADAKANNPDFQANGNVIVSKAA